MKNNFLSASGLSKVFEKVKNFVKPNPPLIGTEQALTGLEINGIKFKAGGETPHLYWHTITLYAEDSGDKVSVIIIALNTSDSQINKQAFLQLLSDNQTAKFVTVVGFVYRSGTNYEANHITYQSATQFKTYYESGSGNYNYIVLNDSAISVCADTVNQIF